MKSKNILLWIGSSAVFGFLFTFAVRAVGFTNSTLIAFANFTISLILLNFFLDEKKKEVAQEATSEQSMNCDDRAK